MVGLFIAGLFFAFPGALVGAVLVGQTHGPILGAVAAFFVPAVWTLLGRP